MIARLLLSGGGLGYLRPASGTWGSLPPPVAALAVVALVGPTRWLEVGLVLTIVLFSLICVLFGRLAETHWGVKDPGVVVADEIAGQGVALLALPWRAPGVDGAWSWNASLALVAFLAFRALDIAKPPPARGLQVLPAGWGILVDDLVAGLYALALTQLLFRVVL